MCPAMSGGAVRCALCGVFCAVCPLCVCMCCCPNCLGHVKIFLSGVCGVVCGCRRDLGPVLWCAGVMLARG